MDDAAYGTRNRRGDWAPSAPVRYAPLFALPPRPWAILRWLPHYFLPWNLLFAASAVGYWAWVVPDVSTLRALGWGWPLRIWVANAVGIFLFFGAFELHLYVLRRQGRRFKYDGRFPAERRSDVFWFRSQNVDNMLRTILSGVTVWTAVEVVVLWAFARGDVPWVGWARHPLYLAVLALAVPVIQSSVKIVD